MNRGGSKRGAGGGPVEADPPASSPPDARPIAASAAKSLLAPESWPAAVTEIRPIASLKLRETNPRAHTLEQIEQISASMKRYGWTIPVLIDDQDVILAGHGRVRAARLMGFDTVPVVIAKGWSEDDKRAYVIADNQLAQNSEWDTKRLRAELRELNAGAYDMALIGFSTDDLTRLMLSPEDVKGGEKGPETVTMKRCPTCGGLSRDDKKGGGK